MKDAANCRDMIQEGAFVNERAYYQEARAGLLAYVQANGNVYFACRALIMSVAQIAREM